METKNTEGAPYNDPREAPRLDSLLGETTRVAGLWIDALRRLLQGHGASTAAQDNESNTGTGYKEGSVRSMGRRLYRSRQDRMVRGVCAGIAEYLGLPTALVRVAFVLLSLPGFIHGVILYIVLAALMPEEPAHDYV